MLWAITLLLTLASCFASSQPLVQERRRVCVGSFCLGRSKSSAFTIENLKSLIERYDYEGDEFPSLQQVPLVTWAGSTSKRQLSYRTWRVDGLEGTKLDLLTGPKGRFSVFLEVQITGKDNLYGNFTGTVPLRKSDQDFEGQKWVNNERGLARGSGNSPWPRRTVFNIEIPTNVNATLIEYTFNGVWSKSSPHTLVL